MQKDNCRSVLINSGNNAAGDNTIVVGGQLGPGIGTVRVWQVQLNSTAANTITFKSNGVVRGGQIVHTGAGSNTTEQGTGVPWTEGLPGQGLVMNNTVGGVTTGTIYYSLA